MREPLLTRELRDLLEHHLGTIDEIEVLLAVFARRDERMAACAVAAAARKAEEAVREHLRQLAGRGFLVHYDDDDSYSYRTRSADLDEVVEQLAGMYEQRPVTLISALYERPSNAVLSFAEAFRIRKG